MESSKAVTGGVQSRPPSVIHEGAVAQEAGSDVGQRHQAGLGTASALLPGARGAEAVVCPQVRCPACSGAKHKARQPRRCQMCSGAGRRRYEPVGVHGLLTWSGEGFPVSFLLCT